MQFKKIITTFLIAVFSWQTMGIAVASTIKNYGLIEQNAKKAQAAVEWQGFESLNPLMSMGAPVSPSSPSVENGDEPLVSMVPITDPVLLEQLNAQLDNPAGQDVMTSGDAKTRRNNMGSLIVNSKTGTVAGNTFDFSESSPMIWARFYPDRGQGYIQVMTIRRTPYAREADGTVIRDAAVDYRNKAKTLRGKSSDIKNPRATDIENDIELKNDSASMDPYLKIESTPLGPEDGVLLATDNGIKKGFRGVNPFEDFVPTTGAAGTKVYSNIKLGAFLAVVGTWARHYGTQRGYVAVAKTTQDSASWNKCEKRVLGMCIRRRYHTESWALVRPIWFALGSGDNAVGKAKVTAFKSSSCMAAAKPSNRVNDLMGDNDCVVFSGVTFLQVSDNADVPNGWMNVWHQHKHFAKTNWWPIIAIVLAVVTFAVSSAMAPLFLGGSSYMAGLIMVGELTFANTLLVLAVTEGVLVGLGAGIIGYLTESRPGGINVGNATGFQSNLDSLGSGRQKDDVAEYLAAITTDNENFWSPGACIVGLPKLPYDPDNRQARYRNPKNANYNKFEHAPNNPDGSSPAATGCIAWLTNGLKDAPGAVGEFYRLRRPITGRSDFVNPNEVKQLKTQSGVLQRWDTGNTPILRRQ